VADELQRDAEQALEEAVRILGPRAQPLFVNGFVTEALLRVVEQAEATLVAIGSHGHHRATEIMIGGVAGELLHEATCSVLVARPASAAAFPGPIVVGIDGSSEGEAALAASRELATRLDVALRVVVANRGKQLDLARVHSLAPGAEEIAEHPLPALVDASRDAALVVVGSRGLHGLRALGSVSERVAHRAACSVLVVRAAPDG
jgi:nucleotide-binding universal stress UspA family protein